MANNLKEVTVFVSSGVDPVVAYKTTEMEHSQKLLQDRYLNKNNGNHWHT